jgi:hypothetical protein
MASRSELFTKEELDDKVVLVADDSEGGVFWNGRDIDLDGEEFDDVS